MTMSATALLLDDAQPGLAPGENARVVQASGLALTPTEALTRRFAFDAASGATLPGPVILNSGSEPRQGFRIGELQLMIRYEDSSELSEMAAMHRLPNAPDWFCGVANLRGKLTPVFDLARYLGVEPRTDAKRMLLVLARGADATGVVIDGLPERLRWSADAAHDVGAVPQRLVPHVRGACLLGGQLWFDLDTHSLLGEIEHVLESAQ
jgi:chemotaxis signal transduction protein